jgi:hypothetical protein
MRLFRHNLGGNTSGLLWWYTDLDLTSSVHQRSRQLLLTSQLVSFISPDRCTPIGAPVTSQVFDIGLEPYVPHLDVKSQIGILVCSSLSLNSLLEAAD